MNGIEANQWLNGIYRKWRHEAGIDKIIRDAEKTELRERELNWLWNGDRPEKIKLNNCEGESNGQS